MARVWSLAPAKADPPSFPVEEPLAGFKIFGIFKRLKPGKIIINIPLYKHIILKPVLSFLINGS